MEYKKTLLCYSLCWSLLAVWFWSDLRTISALYDSILPPLSSVTVTYLGGSSYIFSVRGYVEHACNTQMRGGGRAHADGKKAYAGVCVKLFR